MKAKLIRADLVRNVLVDGHRIRGFDRVTNLRLLSAFRQDFESGRLDRLPEVPTFAIVYLIGGSDYGTHELSANIIAPTGDYPDEPTRHTIEWPVGAEEIESILGLKTLIVTGTGRYEVRFAYDGEPLAILPLDVQWDDRWPP